MIEMFIPNVCLEVFWAGKSHEPLPEYLASKKLLPEIRKYNVQIYMYNIHIIYVILDNIILYHIMSCYIMLYHIISYHIISYYMILCHIILYYVILYHIIYTVYMSIIKMITLVL